MIGECPDYSEQDFYPLLKSELKGILPRALEEIILKINDLK